MADLYSFISLQELLLCSGVIILASILQVSIGMGFGMLASPLIALVRPDLVPGSILTMGLVVAFAGTWRERANISMNEMKLGIGGRIIGSLISVCILALIVNLSGFLVVFGLLMLIAIGLAASGIQFEFNDRNLFGLSIVSGVVGTITAVGAPPMAIIYHNRPPETVRPTLNAFFFSGSVLGLIGMGVTGWLGWNDFLAASIFLPAMFFGIFISGPFKALPSKWMSRFLLSLSALASILLIIRGLS